MNKLDEFLNSVTFTSAVVGYLVEGDKVCLGLRKEVSFGLGEHLVAGIGGKVGDSPEIRDETPAMAMDREASEEIGIRIVEKQEMGRVRFMFSHKPLNSSWNQDVTIYCITRWDGIPAETESTRPAWFDMGRMPWQNMWADNVHWLPKVLSGQRVDAIFLFDADNHIALYRLQ
jgi:8-oxo-dGTP pyrophosphatase MutT (NUDIX family)